MAAQSTRAAKLAGLRRMLDELDANPLLPVPTAVTYDVAAESDLDGFEAVSRIAHRLDVPLASSLMGTQRAAKQFGPVTLAYVYHPALVVGSR
jgi:hypothetical protein